MGQLWLPHYFLCLPDNNDIIYNKDFIEKGFVEAKNMNFYKFYFRDEEQFLN